MNQTDKQWALERILELDLVLPGLAGSFLRSSSERRHVISAFLATQARVRLGDDETAKLLMNGRHDSILAAAYMRPAIGFRSALRKTVNRIQRRSYYRYLHAILSSEEANADVISQLPFLDLDRLRVLTLLPKAIQSPRLVMLQRDADQAKQSDALFGLLIESGIDSSDLAIALRAVETQRQLSACWLRWAERTTFPVQPLGACERYEPIRNAAELKQLSLSYRNCARRYLTDMLEGSVAFALFRTPQGEAIIHLRMRDERWWFEDCHGRDNTPVPKPLHESAVRFLQRKGITAFQRTKRLDGKWEPLREITARWDFTDYAGWG